MQKRRIISCILILFFIFAIPFMVADNESENTSNETISSGSSESDISLDGSVNEEDLIDKAYSCLDKEVNEKGCESLSVEQKIFSLWANGNCKNSLLSDRQNSECWSVNSDGGECDIKTTAQAILALRANSENTEVYENWLLDNKQTPNEIFWYLQIESSEETSCKISYDEENYNVKIGEDKKISSSAGTCLSLSSDRYWLRVSDNCYDKEIKVSCDKSFTTNLLFKKSGSSIIHVSDKIQSSSAEGTTTEEVNSYCFSSPSQTGCDYEGSLWSAMALSSTDNKEEVEKFYPYLIALEESNNQYLPEAFLYFLTGYDDFRNTLLLEQKSDQYWESGSGNSKFYDTSLALYPFIYENPAEKGNSKSWLLDVQEEGGCWNNQNIRDTSFVLISVWPQENQGSSSDVIDCEEQGNYCLSSMDCQEAGGEEISGQTCAGSYVCCDKPKTTPTCEAQGGIICGDEEKCTEGRIEEASDTLSGETCCVGGGSCEEIVVDEQNECEIEGGICSFGCADGEKEVDYECDSISETCCVEKEDGGGWLWFWIILLLLLIVLVVLAIIFRDRLRPYWYKTKTKFKQLKNKIKNKKNKKQFPNNRNNPNNRYKNAPGPSSRVQLQGQGRMIPNPNRNRPTQSPPKPQPKKKSSEIDDVLKKLKDMGNN
ncbi:MAG: hypothetical protein ACOCUU_00355 [Nanoarchaeota archaeon]